MSSELFADETYTCRCCGREGKSQFTLVEPFPLSHGYEVVAICSSQWSCAVRLRADRHEALAEAVERIGRIRIGASA